MADSLCSGSRESRQRGGESRCEATLSRLTVTRPACILLTLGTLKRYLPTVVEPPVPPSYSHLVRRRAIQMENQKKELFWETSTAASFSKFKPTCPKKNPSH